MSKALAAPSERNLEALSPSDRWDLEDAISEAQETLREFNDAELRRWVQEGKTQTWIAEQVGRSQSRVQQRCAALGLAPTSNRGRPRITSPGNSDSDADEPAEPSEGEILQMHEQAVAQAKRRMMEAARAIKQHDLDAAVEQLEFAITNLRQAKRLARKAA